MMIIFKIDTHGPYHTGHPDSDDRGTDLPEEVVVDTDLPEAPLDSDFCDHHPDDHRIVDVHVVDFGLGTHRTAPVNASDSASADVGVVVEVHDDNDHHIQHNDDHNDPWVGEVHASCGVVVVPDDRPVLHPDESPVYPHHSHCGHFDAHRRPHVDVPHIPR